MEIKNYNPTDKEKLIYYHTILANPYVKFKPYPKQAIPVLLASKEETPIDGVRKPNAVLAGAGGFGGKTFLGSMLACQFLNEPDYTCLVTRRNYAELLDTNSIWENLLDWCCGDHLPEDKRCVSVKSPSPKIEAPNGNTIYFKAFDHEDKKQKFKSASYDRVVNDEASELPNGILQFQYRSLRNTIHLPRSIINLSNPGGESTDYLVEQFVDGPKPYVALDWRDNPHIDKAAYEGSLNELDYIDQQYQKYGNWHYKPSTGDLISRDELNSQLVEFTSLPMQYSLMGIDLAGKGKDKFAVVRYDLLQNGLEVVTDFNQTSSANAEDLLLNFVAKHNSGNFPVTSLVVIEQEGGGSPEYARKYFQDLLSDYHIPVILKPPKGSKYQRARPLMRKIKQGQVKLNKNSEFIDDFIDESVSLDPTGKGKSPNLVDSVTLVHNYLHEEILGKQTRIKRGVRLG